MKLHVHDEKVRSNIELIIDEVKRLRQNHPERIKVLHFVFHRQTGMLQLPKVKDSDYLPIDLHIDLEARDVYFSDQLVGVEKMALNTLTETCTDLKKIVLRLIDIRQLVHLDLQSSLEGVKGSRLLHEAWHSVDRAGAEKILKGHAKGSFLFRKDNFAAGLEEILSRAKNEKINCFTLTFIDYDNQVRDKTILRWNNRWMFYDDDPTLTKDFYSSFEDLLASLGAVLKKPVLNLAKV